ncbi:hypothetical protein HDE_09852 [Halotydeus destructor]|nr:hypothetical protein HDE_09852 [Halotydeus destructor]
MANEKVNQLTADLTEARDQLSVFLHQEKVKKRRSADQSPVIHSTTWIGQWMLQDRVFAAAKEAVAMTPDLELISNQILKPLNDPNSSFQWFCKVSDRDPDGRVYIPPSANHIIFSIQGITVHLSYRSKQSPSDILVSSSSG